MGCDIHVHVEHKVNGIWSKVPDTLGPVNPWYDSTRSQTNINQPNIWDLDRNYALFGVLAGVRSNINPILAPRGIPQDLSQEVFDSYQAWGGDCHTPSYYLLSELLVGKEYSYMEHAYVDVAGWIKHKDGIDISESNHVNMYCDGISVSHQEMDRISNMAPILGEEKYYTNIVLDIKYKKIYSWFWDSFLGAMCKIDSNPDNVRMVFWFDN